MAATTERWLTRGEYDPAAAEAEMLPAVDREPSLVLTECLEKAGVLEAPGKLHELSKLVVSMSAELDQLHAEVKSLREAAVNRDQGLVKALDLLTAAVGKSVVAKVEMPEGMVKVEQSVPVDEMGQRIVEGLQKFLVPLVKALAERPISEVHHKVVEVSPQHTVEHVHAPAAQATVDTAPLAEVLQQQTKTIAKLLAKQQPPQPVDLTPLVERMAEQSAQVAKALNVLAESKRQPTKTKTYKNYEGDYITETVE